MTITPPAKRERKSHIFERDEFDHYVETLDVGPAIFRELNLPPGTVVVDPCCGWGRMLRGAQGAGCIALGSDIVPRWDESPDGPFEPAGVGRYAVSLHAGDWFSPHWPPVVSAYWRKPAVIASNPPFDRLEEWLALALERSAWMVVAIVPRNFVWGDKRSLILAETPLYRFLPIVPRPSMPPGAAILAGQKQSGDTKDYAVAIWLKGYRGTWQGGWLRRTAR